jgi:hypothetical protein
LLPLKSGIPEKVDIPAPLRKTQFSDLSRRLRNLCMKVVYFEEI